MKTLILTDLEFAMLQRMNSFVVNCVADEDIYSAILTDEMATEAQEDDELAAAWHSLGEKLG